MNVVMIIPTGIGCEIGGHAGDATPAAKLLAACFDKLILHTNVVNASDINEMPPNSLYVDVSILDRFLEGTVQLEEVHSNKILVAVNAPVRPETINAVSAARPTMGADVSIVELDPHLIMVAKMQKQGLYRFAGGKVAGVDNLIEQVSQHTFDALAVATLIECSRNVALDYFHKGGVNPWGKVEAMASSMIANKLNKPVAHAPIETTDKALKTFNEVVDPRIAAEVVSQCYLHCVLKGLHQAPRIGKGLSVEDIDVLVSPYNCWGRPHIACRDVGIPILIAGDNEIVFKHDVYHEKGVDLVDMMESGEVVLLENYLEVAGWLMSRKAGVSMESVRRPLEPTKVMI